MEEIYRILSFIFVSKKHLMNQFFKKQMSLVVRLPEVYRYVTIYRKVKLH